MENTKENLIEETKGITGRSKSGSVEVAVSQELEKVKDNLAIVKNIISHDLPLSLTELDVLEESLRGMKIVVDGKEMTVEELEKDSELIANMKIWKEVKNGNFDHINEMTKIPDEIAQILAKKNNGVLSLSLDKLTSLPDTVAKYLAEYKGDLYFRGLSFLSDAAAEQLARHRKELRFHNLSSISDTVAKYLGQHQGHLILLGLTSVSETGIQYLSKHQGPIYLNDLPSVSDKAIEYLADHKGEMVLGITSLSVEAYQNLARHDGPIFLDRLTSISDKVAELLATNTNIKTSAKVKAQIAKLKK